jgi:hypothetical protein
MGAICAQDRPRALSCFSVRPAEFEFARRSHLTDCQCMQGSKQWS